VLSGIGLRVGLITRPENSYEVWCVCDSEASIMRHWPTRGCRARRKKQRSLGGATAKDSVNDKVSVAVYIKFVRLEGYK
jgi:hypothetical protein